MLWRKILFYGGSLASGITLGYFIPDDLMLAAVIAIPIVFFVYMSFARRGGWNKKLKAWLGEDRHESKPAGEEID